MNLLYTYLKKYCLILVLLLTVLPCIQSVAQITVTLGTGTASTSTNAFVATTTTANRYSYNFTIYSATEILNGGGYAGLIEKLAWDKDGSGESSGELKIYLKHVNFTQHTTTLQTWADVITGADLVFSSNSYTWSAGSGWKELTLQNPFHWNGVDNLAVLVDWYRPGDLTTGINWRYTTVTDANKWRIGSSPISDMNQVNANRANMQVSLAASGPCTSPPTPGVAVSTKTNLCAGESFTLNVTGNSLGSGQTYQWQSSLTGNAPWTDIGTLQTIPPIAMNQTITTWYRAALTCNGNTAYSDSVQVITPALINGTFTINNGLPTGSGNFTNFADAINSIKCGIDGPVTFNVAPGSGPYVEQIVIPEVFGASATNRISFRGNGAIIEFDPVTANRHVIKLDGAKYVTIDSFEIRTTGTTTTSFGWGIHLTNGASYDSIKRNIISIGSLSTTQSNSAGIVASGSTTSATTAGIAEYNVIANNTISGGYQGIILTGTSATLNKDNQVINNSVQDFYSNGIIVTNSNNVLIAHNDISRITRATVTTFHGIELGAGNIKALVDGNIIHDTHNGATTQSGAAYGIFNTANDATAGNENKVVNNLIYNFNSATGTQYGIYNSSSDGVQYYHNTIVLDNTSSTDGATKGFYQTTAATNIEFKNNIIYITRGGSGTKHAVHFNTPASVIAADYNVLYVNVSAGSTVGVGAIGTVTTAGNNFPTLANWKTAVNNTSPNSGATYDQNSIDADPMFINAGAVDYTPSNPLVDNIGVNVGIAEDILGNARAVSSPDPGAFEFSVAGDLVPPAIVYTLLQNTPSLSNRTITATITDFGGVATGTKGPRLYYKKSTDAVFVTNSNPTISGDDYTFTFDYSLLGGVTGGTIIEYYIAAQDVADNVGTNPTGGGGINPPGTIPPSTVNQYKITNTISGVYTVGAGENFDNLTAIANAIANNEIAVGGNVTFELTNSYDGTTGETLPINFVEFQASDPSWTVTIRPAAGVTGRITSGDPGSNFAFGVINFEGGDRYIFDGRPGGIGTDNEWTIRNTRTSASIGTVIRFVNGATYNTIRNINIESQATLTTTGAVFFHTSTATDGNSFNNILNNHIRGRADVSNATISNGILSNGTATALNTANTITGNHIYNFNNIGLSLVATGNGPDWVISNNHFYNATTATAGQTGIAIASATSTNLSITGNFIGGSSESATGVWTNTGNVAITGINITNGVAKIIGNTIANITATNTGTTVRVRGIAVTSANDNIEINNNIIHDLLSSGGATGYTAGNQPVTGLHIWPGSTFYNITISGNEVYNISAENTAAAATTNIACGMFLTNFKGEFSKNKIHSIQNKGTGTTTEQPPIATGIYARFLDDAYLVNNIIDVGTNENTNTQFSAFVIVSGTIDNEAYLYNNTFRVSGSAGGNWNSYTVLRGDNSATPVVCDLYMLNNIFLMQRSGGGSVNYAIGNQGGTVNWTSDYNLLYNSTDANAVGSLNGAGYDFAGWKTASAQDANSISVQPVFVSADNLHLALTGGVNCSVNAAGTPLTLVTTDIDGESRDASTPDIGADEFNDPGCTLPVTLLSFTGKKEGTLNLLQWQTASEINNAGFALERSADGTRFSSIAFVNSKAEQGNSTALLDYNYTDARPLAGNNYYRLKQTDKDGKVNYSNIVLLKGDKINGVFISSLYPNPAQNEVNVRIESSVAKRVTLVVTDISGRILMKRNEQLQSGTTLVSVITSQLAQGSYLMKVICDDDCESPVMKFMKQ